MVESDPKEESCSTMSGDCTSLLLLKQRIAKTSELIQSYHKYRTDFEKTTLALDDLNQKHNEAIKNLDICKSSLSHYREENLTLRNAVVRLKKDVDELKQKEALHKAADLQESEKITLTANLLKAAQLENKALTTKLRRMEIISEKNKALKKEITQLKKLLRSAPVSVGDRKHQELGLSVRVNREPAEPNNLIAESGGDEEEEEVPFEDVQTSKHDGKTSGSDYQRLEACKGTDMYELTSSKDAESGSILNLSGRFIPIKTMLKHLCLSRKLPPIDIVPVSHLPVSPRIPGLKPCPGSCLSDSDSDEPGSTGDPKDIKVVDSSSRKGKRSLTKAHGKTPKKRKQMTGQSVEVFPEEADSSLPTCETSESSQNTQGFLSSCRHNSVATSSSHDRQEPINRSLTSGAKISADPVHFFPSKSCLSSDNSDESGDDGGSRRHSSVVSLFDLGQRPAVQDSVKVTQGLSPSETETADKCSTVDGGAINADLNKIIADESSVDQEDPSVVSADHQPEEHCPGNCCESLCTEEGLDVKKPDSVSNTQLQQLVRSQGWCNLEDTAVLVSPPELDVSSTLRASGIHSSCCNRTEEPPCVADGCSHKEGSGLSEELEITPVPYVFNKTPAVGCSEEPPSLLAAHDLEPSAGVTPPGMPGLDQHSKSESGLDVCSSAASVQQAKLDASFSTPMCNECGSTAPQTVVDSGYHSSTSQNHQTTTDLSLSPKSISSISSDGNPLYSSSKSDRVVVSSLIDTASTGQEHGSCAMFSPDFGVGINCLDSTDSLVSMTAAPFMSCVVFSTKNDLGVLPSSTVTPCDSGTVGQSITDSASIPLSSPCPPAETVKPKATTSGKVPALLSCVGDEDSPLSPFRRRQKECVLVTSSATDRGKAISEANTDFEADPIKCREVLTPLHSTDLAECGPSPIGEPPSVIHHAKLKGRLARLVVRPVRAAAFKGHYLTPVGSKPLDKFCNERTASAQALQLSVTEGKQEESAVKEPSTNDQALSQNLCCTVAPQLLPGKQRVPLDSTSPVGKFMRTAVSKLDSRRVLSDLCINQAKLPVILTKHESATSVTVYVTSLQKQNGPRSKKRSCEAELKPNHDEPSSISCSAQQSKKILQGNQCPGPVPPSCFTLCHAVDAYYLRMLPPGSLVSLVLSLTEASEAKMAVLALVANLEQIFESPLDATLRFFTSGSNSVQQPSQVSDLLDRYVVRTATAGPSNSVVDTNSWLSLFLDSEILFLHIFTQLLGYSNSSLPGLMLDICCERATSSRVTALFRVIAGMCLISEQPGRLVTEACRVLLSACPTADALVLVATMILVNPPAFRTQNSLPRVNSTSVKMVDFEASLRNQLFQQPLVTTIQCLLLDVLQTDKISTPFFMVLQDLFDWSPPPNESLLSKLPRLLVEVMLDTFSSSYTDSSVSLPNSERLKYLQCLELLIVAGGYEWAWTELLVSAIWPRLSSSLKVLRDMKFTLEGPSGSSSDRGHTGPLQTTLTLIPILSHVTMVVRERFGQVFSVTLDTLTSILCSEALSRGDLFSVQIAAGLALIDLAVIDVLPIAESVEDWVGRVEKDHAIPLLLEQKLQSLAFRARAASSLSR